MKGVYCAFFGHNVVTDSEHVSMGNYTCYEKCARCGKSWKQYPSGKKP